MLKNYSPLFFVCLSLISIKLSSEAYSDVYIKEPKSIELSGLKILVPTREPSSTIESKKTQTPATLNAEKPKDKTTCIPIDKKNIFEKNFIKKHQEALNKIIGTWYFKMPEAPDFNYSAYEGMTTSSLFVSAQTSLKKPFGQDKGKASDKRSFRHVPSGLFSTLYYRDRENDDAIFYLYSTYIRLQVEGSNYEYLKSLLRDSSVHKSLVLEVNKAILKLSESPESLFGAYQLTKKFRGLSSGSYLEVLKHINKEKRIELAKAMIKPGDDKSLVNEYLEWSPGAYQAAYTVLKGEEMARSYTELAELKKLKLESNRSFVNLLEAVETDCDLEEAWSVANPIIREL